MLIIKIELDYQTTWVGTHELQEITHESKRTKRTKQRNQHLFFWCERKNFPIHNPISFEEFASKNAIVYLHFIFFHVRKKVAWKSSTFYKIVVNLFNYSKPT
jgi:hypothetical protein